MEEELLKQPHSDRLTEIGLAMLKMISSHRGLTCVHLVSPFHPEPN